MARKKHELKIMVLVDDWKCAVICHQMYYDLKGLLKKLKKILSTEKNWFPPTLPPSVDKIDNWP